VDFLVNCLSYVYSASHFIVTGMMRCECDVCRKLSRRRRPTPLSLQTPEIRIDELKDESEDGYASDSTSDSASELDYADTEDASELPSPTSVHLHGTQHTQQPSNLQL